MVVIIVAVWFGIQWSIGRIPIEGSNGSKPLPPESRPVGTVVNLPTVEHSSDADSDHTVITPGSRHQIGQLVNDAIRGNAQAQRDLKAIAQDMQEKIGEREIAIRYLGKSDRPELLIIVAKQLLSPDPEIRTAAYYSLPVKIRPEGYDYTSEPTESSVDLIDKLINQIQQ